MQHVQTHLILAVILNYSVRTVTSSSPKFHMSCYQVSTHFSSILSVSVVIISLVKYWRASFTLDTGLGSVGTPLWPKRYDDEYSPLPGSPVSVAPTTGSTQFTHQSCWPLSYAQAMA